MIIIIITINFKVKTIIDVGVNTYKNINYIMPFLWARTKIKKQLFGRYHLLYSQWPVTVVIIVDDSLPHNLRLLFYLM